MAAGSDSTANVDTGNVTGVRQAPESPRFSAFADGFLVKK
jgi:hypothetical protein